VNKNLNKASAAGLLIALGIIYGDIGTSPLYVFKAVVKNNLIDELLIIGAVSCIIWTLTIQTTVKYVILTLQADNKGEGGIFSLYALVRRHGKWTVFFGMIGGAALLADGIITPPITVTSAVEGLRSIPIWADLEQWTIVKVVIVIISIMFFMQQFGTMSIGKLFGPIMFIWFGMLAILGLTHIADDIAILKAFNPMYGITLLATYPSGFFILGAIFLCTTGAEALYSDLGHCGKQNIRVSWIFVKVALILNYLGQGAWLLTHAGSQLPAGVNPFFSIMPSWFVVYGVMNLWPKLKINYPSIVRGQLFIPGINYLLLTGCIIITLIFQESGNMEAAYGLSITLTMLMTTGLFGFFLYTRRVKKGLVALFLIVYLLIEGSFFLANIVKFWHGGYVTILIAGGLFLVMYSWFKARKIKNRYVEFVRLEDHLPIIQELSNDSTIPKYATHLVYMTSADNPKEIEHKIIFSILNRKPKRADIYWFVHVDVVDEPYRCEYMVQTVIPNEIIRVDFKLGFKVEQRINLMFKLVVEDLVKNKEVNINSRYESLSKSKVVGDFQFIVMEKVLSHDNDLPWYEKLVMQLYFYLKKVSLSEERGFGLDAAYVTIEKFPLVVAPVSKLPLIRIPNSSAD
jgi:KUP system potassium uptake protein